MHLELIDGLPQAQFLNVLKNAEVMFGNGLTRDRNVFVGWKEIGLVGGACVLLHSSPYVSFT